MDSSGPIKILFIEDLPYDMELAEIELRKSGINFISKKVETKERFLADLKEFNPDIVISDYLLPQFNGLEASKISREHDATLPFIILTGSLNEETAVECIKTGATDYVMKDHIIKLPLAVKDALKHRGLMREKIKAEKDLHESESRYRSMFENNYAVMCIVDPSTGLIVNANPAAAEYYGYSIENLTGMHISDFDVADKKTLEERQKAALNGNRIVFSAKHKLKNGHERDVEIFCSPVNYQEKILVHCIIQDTTERNKAVQELKASLNQKKDLIREIYHRTKNNLQVIISMFSLQGMYTGDKKLEILLGDMENRIRAISLVHEKLYQLQNLSKLNLKDYLTELVDDIMFWYGITREKIQIENKMENTEVLIDTAIPCGLVVNELVSNVAKYAFPEGRKGVLTISLLSDATGEIELTVSDNGSGRGMKFDFDNITTMGLMIIKNIVEYQLKGSMEIDNTSGISWTIRFSDSFYEERI